MIITTLIGLRLIDYALLNEKELNLFDKIVKFISSISYEIYLVQYPVIFLIQDIKINTYLKILIMITVTILISFIIHFGLSIKKKDKLKVLKIVIITLLGLTSIFGVYKYIVAKDHTKEMKALEEQLNKNELLSKQKQKEIEKKLKEEQESFEKELAEFDLDDEKLREKVAKMPFVGIGDSVMDVALPSLYQRFPNAYFDARTNRTDHEANKILVDLKERGLLTDIIVFNLGTNGECNSSCKAQIMKTIGNRKVYWVNATHPDFPSFNTNLINLAKKYPNIKIIDWISASKDHPEYLISDGVHPTRKGSKAYAETILDYLYEDYKKELKLKKEEKIKEHQQELNKKITFIGNELLLNIYDYLVEEYDSSNYIMSKDYSTSKLLSDLKEKIKNNELSHNIVFVLDNSTVLSKNSYKEILNICKDHNIYFVSITKNNNKDLNIIDFSNEIDNNDKYMMVDKKHLSEEGKKKLTQFIKKYLEEKTK